MRSSIGPRRSPTTLCWSSGCVGCADRDSAHVPPGGWGCRADVPPSAPSRRRCPVSNSTRPSSSSSSSYDERFVVPLEASRRGAHRARVSPIMAALPVTVVVGIVVGAVALVYLFLGGNGSDPGAEARRRAVGYPRWRRRRPPPEAPGAVPSAAPASGAVDKTITLDVFNGTSPTVSGLARKAATKLTAAGWTTGKVGNLDRHVGHPDHGLLRQLRAEAHSPSGGEGPRSWHRQTVGGQGAGRHGGCRG